MGNGVSQIRAVERVEMELVDALGVQLTALLGRDRGSYQIAGLRIVVESFEKTAHPIGHRCATHGAKFHNLSEILNRQGATAILAFMKPIRFANR